MSAFGVDQVGRVLGARYRLLAPVGSGASATVYQADDVQLKRTIAVKLLHPALAADPTFLKRFRAEAQSAASLSHPNVMTVFDWGEDQGTPYLILEYLAGGSLRAMLDVGRRLTPSQALMVGLEAARGLDYAHKRGVVHRDIKPANLLFGDDGRLRIADFGLARAISEASWTEPDGVMLGTARYASPEQATGQPLDGRSDVYSLALSLIESVTGQVPFAAETTVATLMARLNKLMPVSADLGPLAPVLERAGRPDPLERYDATALGRALLVAAERLSRPAPLPLVVLAGPKRQDETTYGVPVLAPSPAPLPPPTMASAGLPAPSVGFPSRDEGAPAGAVTAAAVETGVGEAPLTPPVVGDQLEADRALIKDLNLAPPRKRRARRGVLWLALVAVLAGSGVGAVVLAKKTAKPKTFTVPVLIGMSEGVASNELGPFELNVIVNKEKSDEFETPLTVIRHDPGPGAIVRKKDQIVLTVSDGPTMAKLPEISKLAAADAKALVESRKLVYVETAKPYDEDAPAGTIMSWTVQGKVLAAETEVNKNTPVEVVVSQGPKPRQIPELRGLTWEQIRAALDGVQLKAVRQEDIYSDKWKLGVLAKVEPGIETVVPRGTEVKIWISKGPDVVTVPNVYADSAEKAAQKLTEAGLVQGTIDGPIDRRVIATDPIPGTVVKRGTVVKIRLG